MSETADACGEKQIDGALAAWLRGKPSGLPWTSGNCLGELLRRIDFHGIAGLLANGLPLEEALPEGLQQALRHRAIAQALWEAQHARIIKEVLDSFLDAGLSPLVFKGTALAYSHYSCASTRRRGDSDILVAEDEFGAAAKLLLKLGFTTSLTAGGNVLTAEKSFRIASSCGGWHEIDLHGRLSNSAVLARIFSHAEICERGVALENLCKGARRVGNVDSLLIACLHRLTHLHVPYYVNGVPYLTADRLIWLQDIKLLARDFTDQDWQFCGRLGEEKALTAVLADGLRTTHHKLGLEVPSGWLDRGERLSSRELPARYLASGPIRQFVMDLYATEGLGRRSRFLRELIFPPAEYMQEKFRDARLRWLPWLYLRRAVAGLWKR